MAAVNIIKAVPWWREPTKDQWYAWWAAWLGWTLDAFDFFVLVFLVDTLAAQFGVPASKIILTITVTLAMRPFGALLFGVLADRYGRRRPLMANVVFFSAFELLCGFAPNLGLVILFRALQGFGGGLEAAVAYVLVRGTFPEWAWPRTIAFLRARM